MYLISLGGIKWFPVGFRAKPWGVKCIQVYPKISDFEIKITASPEDYPWKYQIKRFSLCI